MSLEDLANLSIEQIRELMLASGLDQETLDQIDDETLLTVYKQALAEEGVTVDEETGEVDIKSSNTNSNE